MWVGGIAMGKAPAPECGPWSVRLDVVFGEGSAGTQDRKAQTQDPQRGCASIRPAADRRIASSKDVFLVNSFYQKYLSIRSKKNYVQRENCSDINMKKKKREKGDGKKNIIVCVCVCV
uniref:Uncharacterized protein n=1 Tax=Micrurus lemniscatus lemniscatus TaxID=129467 RepID=A0A2D4IWF9_MICLE